MFGILTPNLGKMIQFDLCIFFQIGLVLQPPFFRCNLGVGNDFPDVHPFFLTLLHQRGI